jgi:hypothetical protein
MSGKVIGQVYDLDLDHPEQSILLAYADHADHNGGSVRPSIGLIAWKTGYSTRQVQRITQSLIRAGLLVVVTRHDDAPTEYRIDVSAGKPKLAYEGQKALARQRKGQEGDDITTPPHDIAMSPPPTENVTPPMTQLCHPNRQLNRQLNRQ